MIVMPVPADIRTVTVVASESQFHVRADYTELDRWASVVDGITRFRHGALSVTTGTTYGPVSVSIQELDKAPAENVDGWDVIADRDFVSLESAHPRFPSTGVHIVNINDSHPEGILTERTGRLRLRFHAAGRAEGRRVGQVSNPVERFFVQVWPVEHAFPPRHIHGTDAVMQEILGTTVTRVVLPDDKNVAETVTPTPDSPPPPGAPLRRSRTVHRINLRDH